jgi:hypothetical protein
LFFLPGLFFHNCRNSPIGSKAYISIQIPE